MNRKIRSPRYIIELSREMRINPTRSEAILWNELKGKKVDGFKFRNQHPIHRYILDFFCYEKQLAIEVDGDIHKNRTDYDEYRDEYLKSAGIETLRITNEDVINNIDVVVEKIRVKLHSIAPRPPGGGRAPGRQSLPHPEGAGGQRPPLQNTEFSHGDTEGAV